MAQIRTVLFSFVSALLLIMPAGRLESDGQAEEMLTPQGMVYYVAPTGDDSNPGILDYPWQTIQKAADTLVAGDTVYIRAGTYNERVVPQNSGSAGNIITYAAYPGETATIDGNGVTLPDDLTGLVDISNKSYIAVSGLRVINAGPYDNNAGILVNDSTYITIAQNSTYNTISSGIGVWNSDHIIIDGNTVERACIRIWQECLTVANTNAFEVKNNEVFDCQEEGIDVKDNASNGLVYRNHVHDVHAIGIYIDAWDRHTHDIQVFQNRIHHVSGYNGIALASEMGGLLENIAVYNNLVYQNHYAGLDVSVNDSGSPSGQHPMSNLTIVNNTFYGNGLGAGGGGILVDNPDAQNVVIRNNIVSQNDYFQMLVNPAVPTQTLSLDHNLIDGYRGNVNEGETRGSDCVEGDPLFVNATGADFHLQASSPAIDAGSALGAPNADFDGRPRDTQPDIGAYEAWQPAAWIYLPMVVKNLATIFQAIYAPISPSPPISTAIPSSAYTPQIARQTMAHDYYIDPVNGNDENSGASPQAAWRTFRNIFSYRSDYLPAYAILLEPGDTIYLMNGIHSAIYRPGDDSGPTNGRPAVMRFRDVHGVEQAPIRLLAYPGHQPVIDPDYEGEGLYILDSSWLEIAGVEFRRAMSQGEGGNIAMVTSNHIKLHDVEVHDADGADDDNISGLNATDVWDVEIHNCSFHDNYDRTAADTGGISTHNSTNMVFFLGGNISVHDCLIYQSPTGSDMTQVNSGMGIKYKHASASPTAYFHVYHNVFRNNKYWAFLSGTANTHFHHNIVIGGSGLGAGSEDCGGPTHQTNQVYEYNTFYQVYSANRQYSAGGFYLYPTTEWRSADFPSDPSHIVFQRNIVYDDLDYCTESATANIYPYISDDVYNATAPNLQFDHNCYFNPNYDLRFSFAAGENQGSLGGYYTFDEWQALTWLDPSNGQSRPLGYDTHSVVADPQFISIDPNLNQYDPTSNAYRPARGSGCEIMGAYAGNLVYLPLVAKNQATSETGVAYAHFTHWNSYLSFH